VKKGAKVCRKNKGKEILREVVEQNRQDVKVCTKNCIMTEQNITEVSMSCER